MYVQYCIQCVTILVQYGVPYLECDLHGGTIFIECASATRSFVLSNIAPYGVVHFNGD